MEPISNIPAPVQHRVFQPTLVSRWLAIGLFITLPFIAGYIGFQKGTQMTGETIVYQTIVSTPTDTVTTAVPTSLATTTSPISPIDEDLKVPTTGSVDLQANGLTISLQYASSVEESIIVKEGEMVLQTIIAPTESRLTDSCGEEFLSDSTKLQDLDFDGDLDLGLLTVKTGGHCAYKFYTYYLFDETKKQFSTSTSLYFSDGPIVDPVKKTLSFLSRTGIDWVETIYYFRDGKYYRGTESTHYSDSDPEDLEDMTTPGA